MILMTALVTGPEAPQFNGYFRNLFHGNCCGGSCTGVSTSASTSCHGCCGGLFSGERVRSWFSFSGGCCGGSCTGRTATGFSTSCTGCCGGSCYGGIAYGGCVGAGMPMAPIYDGGLMPGTTIPIPSAPLPGTFDGVPPATPRPAGPPGEIGDGSRAFRPQLPAPPGLSPRATVTVKVPTDARLFAEGQPLTHSGGEKSFVTPELPSGRDFTYTFRAEYVRDGEKVAREKQLTVRSGGSYTLEFDEKVAKPTPNDTAVEKKMPKTGEKTSFTAIPPVPSPLAALTGGKDPSSAGDAVLTNPASTKEQDRAKITVKLPAGATLFVDGKKNAKADPTREFVTPPLQHGKEYVYTMMAELGGKAGTITHKVTFRAGELITVDFTAGPPSAANVSPAESFASR